MRKTLLLALVGAAFADEDPLAKAKALAQAGPAAAREAIPELIALGRGAPEERFAARDALVVAGPPAVAKLIEGAAGDGAPRLLLEGVSRDLGAGVVVAALPALSSKDARVRAAAAVSLGAAGAGGEAAVKRLVELLYDEEAGVRREAALALGGIGRGAHDAASALIFLANEPARDAQREALLALGMILRDAAERERPVRKVASGTASAIESGLAWLARQEGRAEGWGVPAAAPEKARIYVASLAVLAMLEGGAPERYAPHLRAALRYVVAADASAGHYPYEAPWWIPVETVTATLCAAARVLDEPECRAAAERHLNAAWTNHGTGESREPGPPAWEALLVLEAGFAGLLLHPGVRDIEIHDAGALPTALVRLAAGRDPGSDELRSLIESGSVLPKPGGREWWIFAARARWYGGLGSDAIVAEVCKTQLEDGSWTGEGDPHGSFRTTACMLLALEAASGLARPLALPLPDAPQLKAAAATLRVAAASKDDALRAAAEQALAGFAVR
jgi:hypothetical protein